MSKAAINVGANMDLYSGLMFEKFAQTIAFSTQDPSWGHLSVMIMVDG